MDAAKTKVTVFEGRHEGECRIKMKAQELVVGDHVKYLESI